MTTGIASNPQITDLAGPGRNEYSFRISPSDSAMMEALGTYLGEKKVFKNVAIIGEDTDFGRGGADAFKKVAEKAGVTVVSTDFHPQNTPDFTSILTRIQQRRPDAIATFQVGGDSINFLRQAMQLGVRIPYTGRIELGGRNQPIIEAGGMDGNRSAPGPTMPRSTRRRTRPSSRRSDQRQSTIPSTAVICRLGAATMRSASLPRRSGMPTVGTEGPKIKDAIKNMKPFTNVMGRAPCRRSDDHNSAGRFVVLQTVNNKKVGVADIVEVK